MGLFGKKARDDDDLESVLRETEDLVTGRGLNARMTRAFMGREFVQDMQGTVDSAREAMAAQAAAQEAAAAAGAGAPTIVATVATVADTGQLINFDPVMVITATLADGRPVQLQTLVSKLQIPRPGDRIQLVENPAQPGALVYAGLAG